MNDLGWTFICQQQYGHLGIFALGSLHQHLHQHRHKYCENFNEKKNVLSNPPKYSFYY